MASEAIVTVVVERLANQLMQEARLLRGVRDQLEWIEGELRQMQSFLRDAEEKQERSANMKIWVKGIRDVTYDAEDVIDTYILNKAQQRRRFMKRYAFIFNDLITRRKFGKEIERIKKKIREISERRITYGIENVGWEIGEGSSTSKKLQEERRTSPHFGSKMSIVGLNRDVKELEQRLMSEDLGLRVISIVGMGGVGKTTLAKTVYNSDFVKRYFDCCAWVYVSQHYQIRELLNEIEKQVLRSGGEKSIEENVDVRYRFYHFLKNKRYLIVMDDIWTTNVWTSLEMYFPDTRVGSRILLTTRNIKIASTADQWSYSHMLRPLNDQDSWELFTKDNDCPQHLERLGMCMLKKCMGLPLAIVMLRGLLSSKNANIDAWKRLFDSLNWHLNNESEICSTILALSYIDLPLYLKPCFFYFGLFPKGFEIPIRRLIRLWIAEGFVKKRGEEALEDVGKDYIEELVARNVIQVVEGKDYIEKSFTQVEKGNLEGRKPTCRMHDLVQDLALSKAKEANFYVVNENRDNISLTRERVRRLSVHFDTRKSIFNLDRLLLSEHSTVHLRSLLSFDVHEREVTGSRIRWDLRGGIFNRRFELLRVLDLEGVYKPWLPKELGKLIHLRYLGLRHTSLDRLPSSVGDLFNLQTLDLKWTKINIIPSAIWGMEQLRHLYLNWGLRSIVHQPSGNSLRNLQTLWGIFVGEKKCVKDGLDKLDKIRKLGMEGDLVSEGEALVEWISRLDRLECLKLTASSPGKLPPEIPSFSTAAEHSHAIPMLMSFSDHMHLVKLQLEGRLEKLFDPHEFPPYLTTLNLVKSQLENDPMKTLEQLPNLRILRLQYKSYMGASMVCTSGGFLKLEVLQLGSTHTVEEWVVENGAMQHLRELIIECERLRMLPDGLRFLTNLKELNLLAMPEEFRARLLPNIGDDRHKIIHIPFIRPPLLDSIFSSNQPTNQSSRSEIQMPSSSNNMVMAATAKVCDANPQLIESGKLRALEPIFKIYGQRRVFSGPVVTLKVLEDNFLVRDYLEEKGNGRILVVDGGRSVRCAILGGNHVELAQKNGWAGIVVNGCLRDVVEINKCDIGVRALASHSMKANKKGIGERHVLITIAGTQICDGEWLYADADGILVSQTELSV